MCQNKKQQQIPREKRIVMYYVDLIVHEVFEIHFIEICMNKYGIMSPAV